MGMRPPNSAYASAAHALAMPARMNEMETAGPAWFLASGPGQCEDSGADDGAEPDGGELKETYAAFE